MHCGSFSKLAIHSWSFFSIFQYMHCMCLSIYALWVFLFHLMIDTLWVYLYMLQYIVVTCFCLLQYMYSMSFLKNLQYIFFTIWKYMNCESFFHIKCEGRKAPLDINLMHCASFFSILQNIQCVNYVRIKTIIYFTFILQYC